MTDAAKNLRDKIVSIAKKELGYQESPAGSNMTKFGKWYGLNGYAWCMMFVMWVFDQAGILSALPKRTASCSDLKNAAKAAGCWITENYQPGDVLIYTFGHTGIVEKINANGSISAIEGNTGNTSENNGGEVMRKTRTKAQCYGAVRVDWEAAASALSASKTMTSAPALLLVAQGVLDGRWGNGEERKNRLTSAGYNPAEIQSLANALANGTLRVSIAVTTFLNVRTSPGTNGKIVQKLQNGVVQTVTEVREGVGSDNGWGKIPTGWIALDHVAVI